MPEKLRIQAKDREFVRRGSVVMISENIRLDYLKGLSLEIRLFSGQNKTVLMEALYRSTCSGRHIFDLELEGIKSDDVKAVVICDPKLGTRLTIGREVT